MSEPDAGEDLDFLYALALKRWEAQDRLFSELSGRMTFLAGAAAPVAGAGIGAFTKLLEGGLELHQGIITALAGGSLVWLAWECLASIRTSYFAWLPNPLSLQYTYQGDRRLIRLVALHELNEGHVVNKVSINRKAGALDRALAAFVVLLLTVAQLVIGAIVE